MKRVLCFFVCVMALSTSSLWGAGGKEHTSSAPVVFPYEDPSLPLDERARDLVSRMSLEEKVYFVVGTGMGNVAFAPSIMGTDRIVPGAAGTTFPLLHFGIPAMVMADGPAGVRISPVREGEEEKTYYCTAFPIARMLASSWDTSLLEEVGTAMGEEALAYGVDMILAPGMNIHRHPLGGRNFEYYSEDPLITGKMAAAFVRGVQSQGIGACLKHYAANNQETNRMSIDTVVSEKALREIYLRGFEIAVKEGQPWAVMSAYNKVNGLYCSEHHWLLTEVLRNEWGFSGLVMTDWFAGKDPVAQMKAGNDLLMPGTPFQRASLLAAVKEGGLDEEVLDRNAERVARIVLGSASARGVERPEAPDLEAHSLLARKAATEGMVLLKNEGNTLPLDPGLRVAGFGVSFYDVIIGGTGSGDVNEAYRISPAEGLTAAGYQVDSDLKERYLHYIEEAKANLPPKKNWWEPEKRIAEWDLPEEMVDLLASRTDVALVTIGRISGEFADRSREEFYLSSEEKSLLRKVSSAFHAKGKKVVVLLNIGGVIKVDDWRDLVDAILLVWEPGQEAGHAIADVLSGRVNPSGRLTTTFPLDYEDVPSSSYFPGTPMDNPERVEYGEGVMVGYRYFVTDNVPVAYEFGYGLSYTTFDLALAGVEGEVTRDEELRLRVEVTNTGDVPGREVVQVYLERDLVGDEPAKVLVGFAKTEILEPGASERVEIRIPREYLAVFDEGADAWIIPAGDYRLTISKSSLMDVGSIPFSVGHRVHVADVIPLD